MLAAAGVVGPASFQEFTAPHGVGGMGVGRTQVVQGEVLVQGVDAGEGVGAAGAGVGAGDDRGREAPRGGRLGATVAANAGIAAPAAPHPRASCRRRRACVTTESVSLCEPPLEAAGVGVGRVE